MTNVAGQPNGRIKLQSLTQKKKKKEKEQEQEGCHKKYKLVATSLLLDITSDFRFRSFAILVTVNVEKIN
jgi:hypothetical protein